ncbi:MAG: DUF2115 domain-containing protein [Methanomicrobiales archaeon]|nr:DUF2115 domain-containing protein [Methanomicrobiales archaeon]
MIFACSGECVPEIRTIEGITTRITDASNQGELGIIIAEEVLHYSVFELQVIGGRLNLELSKLPVSYRNKIMPFFRDQIFGAYHRLLSKYRGDVFSHLKTPISDPELFLSYCQMIPDGCMAWDEDTWKNPEIWSPKHRLFYYLIAAYTMFVEDLPGHPVGMPFPGGQVVEKQGEEYYCPIRDKEKDVFFSICNFCPARQTD